MIERCVRSCGYTWAASPHTIQRPWPGNAAHGDPDLVNAVSDAHDLLLMAICFSTQASTLSSLPISNSMWITPSLAPPWSGPFKVPMAWVMAELGVMAQGRQRWLHGTEVERSCMVGMQD